MKRSSPPSKVQLSIDEATSDLDQLKMLVRKYKPLNLLNLSSVKGFIGELYVFLQLKREVQTDESAISMFGNQTGWDVQIDTSTSTIKIDVKTSYRKIEFFNDNHNHGWALSWYKKDETEKGVSCDVFVCVQLDDLLEPEYYFVFNKSLLDQFPTGMGRFGRVARAFGLLDSWNQMISDGTYEARLAELTESLKPTKKNPTKRTDAVNLFTDSLSILRNNNHSPRFRVIDLKGGIDSLFTAIQEVYNAN